MDSVDLRQIVLMAVALKHGEDFPRRFEYLSYSDAVADSMCSADIEPLMGKNDDWFVRLCKICSEPFKLLRWNIGVRPFRILSTVRLAIAAEARIQHDEVRGALTEGIPRLLFAHDSQKFFLRQRIDAVVSKNIVTLFCQRGESIVDRLQITQFYVNNGFAESS